MKIYSCPKELAFAEPDYLNFDLEKEQAREEKHSADLKAWLIAAGYDGRHTGRIYSTPVADGHASYMFADKGRGGALIHLPYGDAYQSRDIQFLPKAEILKRMESADRLAEMFRSTAPEAEETSQADDGPTPDP